MLTNRRYTDVSNRLFGLSTESVKSARFTEKCSLIFFLASAISNEKLTNLMD